MKVLFQIRKDFIKNIAGDSIVFLNLRKHLLSKGLTIDICTEEKINCRSYDIIHIFNTIRMRESFEFIKNAKFYNKKIVVTPIYWDLREFYSKTNQSTKVEAWEKGEEKRKFILENCDIYLPHCNGEAKLIKDNYRIDTRYEILPYGVDESFGYGNKDYVKEKYGMEQYILCVGRIHHQKNQLGLIKAMDRENIPIILVGSINDKKYYHDCMDQKGKNVLILEKIDREALKSIYKGALVHILPSWIEYPGLASLEAGISGCNVVSTEIGSTKEVFGNLVEYCNPACTTSIHEAVMNAWYKRSNDDFKNYILEKYTWRKIAEKMFDIYNTLV